MINFPLIIDVVRNIFSLKKYFVIWTAINCRKLKKTTTSREAAEKQKLYLMDHLFTKEVYLKYIGQNNFLPDKNSHHLEKKFCSFHLVQFCPIKYINIDYYYYKITSNHNGVESSFLKYHLKKIGIIEVLSLIHIWRCRRSTLCRSRWSPYH